MLEKLKKFLSPKTPSYMIVELEKPVPILDNGDEAAIASLNGHPGMIALLNRQKLRRAVLERQLELKHFKDLSDVYILQLDISRSRAFELELREATKNLENKRLRPATIDETQEFDRILNSIESLRPTTAE